MFVVPKSRTEIRVINDIGQTWAFENVYNAIQALAKVGGFLNSRANHNQRYRINTWIDEKTFQITDAWNDPLERSVIKNAILRIFPVERSPYAGPKAPFRGGPVPFTRCKRNFHGHRRPRTLQEKTRRGCDRDDLEDISLKDHQIVRKRELPVEWDDISRGRERNWKSQRGAQWKKLAHVTGHFMGGPREASETR